MNDIKIKIKKACDQKWSQMNSNKDGNFCTACSKTVIDFTNITHVDLLNILIESKQEICARTSSSQLKEPITSLKKTKYYSLPYSRIAASMMITTSVLAESENDIKTDTYFNCTIDSDNTDISVISSIESITNSISIKNNVMFKGVIISEEDKKPIENAKISFFTLNQVFQTFTDENGLFNLEIPNALVSDKNVIRITFNQITSDHDELSYNSFEGKTLVIPKKALISAFEMYAKYELHYLGGIIYGKEPNPIVIQNGKKISYRKFRRALDGKVSTCRLTDNNYHYFEGDAAIALYGNKAKHGLYLVIDNF